MRALPYVDSALLSDLLPWPTAIAALGRALAPAYAEGGFTERTSVPLDNGELLLMPAAGSETVGVKIIGVAPGNPELGLPRIQGLYTLFDAHTLAPLAVLDGTALTTVRTAGQSAFVVRELAPEQARRLVVFGAGPQAEAHVEAVRAVRSIDTVRIVGRRQERVAALCERLGRSGVDVRPGEPGDVASADIVVCATTSATPVFDGADLADHAFVVAVGSHTPDARELDGHVFSRASLVLVEHRQTALREAGDIVRAVEDGALDPGRLRDFGDLAGLRAGGGISVYKSVGMGWQDLAVAQVVWESLPAGDAR
ncbi:ornithine cyclodeaminase family protein [Streptomyces shenzhenensis]|uniref:ornithine cyclodeaminase family protein n=1 Tax=Streptomyces shenzhenensis TaxID=943815 RepID=UPI00382073D7